jgi:hypothetical protein
MPMMRIMNHDEVIQSPYLRLLRTVDDLSFTTAKQLRHLAEGAGFDFVPIDVLYMGDHEAEFLLRPDSFPPVRVRARREQRWHPFHVTEVLREAA